MALHQLNRYASSPTLGRQSYRDSTSSSSQTPTSSGSLYQSVTPKSSYDSIGSLRSYAQNPSAMPAGNPFNIAGGGPWAYDASSSSSSANSQASRLSHHRSLSQISQQDRDLDYPSLPYVGPNLTMDAELPRDPGAIGPMGSMGSMGSVGSMNQIGSQPGQSAAPLHRPQSLHFQNGQGQGLAGHQGGPQLKGQGAQGPQGPQSAPPTSLGPPIPEVSQANHNVDPAIEKAFRNMAQSINQKDKEIAQLKLRIEALVTASSINMTDSAGRKMDEAEVAHRIVVRLTALKKENERLAKMLSQGRAAQKEVELGLLRQENESLKARIQELEKPQ